MIETPTPPAITDLRRQSITEMAETGSSDATIMSVAGQMDRSMMEHYSHVCGLKAELLDQLESGLMQEQNETEAAPQQLN